MAFPYVSPLAPWMVNVLKQRERNKIMGMFKTPYAILTSTALVGKGGPDIASTDKAKRTQAAKDAIEKPSSSAYKGCIISNNINNIEFSYSTKGSVLGYDFTGKPIVIDTELGRKISTPIIENIEVDTDGANNTLKVARVNVRCFSLKQLEMFELFFLKPGMNVLIEWGDSTFLTYSNFTKSNEPNQPQTLNNTYEFFDSNGVKQSVKPYSSVEEALVSKGSIAGDTAFDDFCDKFSDYFRADSAARELYQKRVQSSLGSYDLCAGKVLEYGYNIDADGTYAVTFEISQGNQTCMHIPHNPQKSKSNKKTATYDPKTTAAEQIKQIITSDLNLDMATFDKLLKDSKIKHITGKNGTNWENDWFNFLKVNENQKQTTASSESYVSLRFVLGILMNYVLATAKSNADTIDKKFFELTLPKYRIGKDMREAIPVTSNKFIISPTSAIIFPNKQLPIPTAPKPAQRGSKNKDKDNEVYFPDDKFVDGSINGYEYHINDKLSVDAFGNCGTISIPSKKTVKGQEDYRLGDALNIFIKYDLVVAAWNSTTTRIDFLNEILANVNSAGMGLYKLVYGSQYENGPGTIIDYKLQAETIKPLEDVAYYRFKPTTIDSIVREFNYSFEMNNLIGARTLFNSAKFIKEALEKNKANATSGKLQLPDEAYTSVDYSTFGNIDGYYSINYAEYKAVKKTFEASEEELKKTASTTAATPTNATSEATDLNSIIKGASIKFQTKASGKELLTLIYGNPALIQNKLKQSYNQAVTTLTDLEVSVQIDGLSGIRSGMFFNIDGIPEIYNKIGIFQVTNIKHSVNKDNWLTTIEARFKPYNKE